MLAVFLDTETNGLNPYKHKVIEIAYKILDVKTGDLKDSFESLVSHSEEDWQKSDPRSLKIHEISWEKVKGGSSIDIVAQKILASFSKHGIQKGKALFICQNPSFDRAFFSQIIDPDIQHSLDFPYHWLDLASMYWSRKIKESPYPWETGISKDRISQTYQLPPEAKPHRAMNGVDHLLLCYETMIGFPQQSALR